MNGWGMVSFGLAFLLGITCTVWWAHINHVWRLRRYRAELAAIMECADAVCERTEDARALVAGELEGLRTERDALRATNIHTNEGEVDELKAEIDILRARIVVLNARESRLLDVRNAAVWGEMLDDLRKRKGLELAAQGVHEGLNPYGRNAGWF